MGEGIRVALAGCGHMGTHHARVLHAHPDCRLVAVVDPVRERAQALADRTGARVEATVPREVDAVVVATPTLTHAAVAAPLLARGQWCLVEKPVAASSDEAALLRDPRLVVGHSERFNPAVRSLPDPRPRLVQARRMAPPNERGLDVDVVLDLMIHDLDLLLGWADASAEVEVIDATGVSVHGGQWDVASVRLRVGRIVASLAASRVAPRAERRVELSGQGSSISLDLLAGEARIDGSPVDRPDGRDALTAQWDAFVGAMRGVPAHTGGGEGAIRALALAERVRGALVEQEGR